MNYLVTYQMERKETVNKLASLSFIFIGYVRIFFIIIIIIIIIIIKSLLVMFAFLSMPNICWHMK